MAGKTFADLSQALSDLQGNVNVRENAKALEADAAGELLTTTTEANAAVEAKRLAREQANAATKAARAKVDADRRALHALIDEVTADPADVDNDGEDD